MGNKYNNVFANSNRNYYSGATNSTQHKFASQESNLNNGFLGALKWIFHFIGRFLLLLLRIALVIVILGVIAIILIALMYPESHQQFREVSQLAWNKIIYFLTNLLN